MRRVICGLLCVVTIVAVGLNIESSRQHLDIVEHVDLLFKDGDYQVDSYKAYDEFIDKNKRHRKEISEVELERSIDEALIHEESNESNREKLSASRVRQIIFDGLNIEFLVSGIDQRKLVVTTIEEKNYKSYRERRLIFKDPFVGEFEVLVLIPARSVDRYPAIIGLHGHKESATFFKDHYLGVELVNAGFIVLMPSFRVMDHNRGEVLMSYKLLLNGFTLMGMRVYEVLLLLKYVQSLDYVSNDNIGLLSHSGGSAVANLLVHATEKIKVQAVDYYSTYIDLIPGILYKKNNSSSSYRDSTDNVVDHRSKYSDSLQGIHCETIPTLYYYHDRINNKDLLRMQVLNAPYTLGDAEWYEKIIEFFIVNLATNND